MKAKRTRVIMILMMAALLASMAGTSEAQPAGNRGMQSSADTSGVKTKWTDVAYADVSDAKNWIFIYLMKGKAHFR